jgi:hypothetical protein
MTNEKMKDVSHVGIGNSENSMEDPSTSAASSSENMTSGD